MRPIGRWWNWKCALLSCALRGTLFFTVNATAGLRAAEAALLHDLAFRAAIAGAFGAVLERLSRAGNRALATTVSVVVLPSATHVLEALVHRQAGTARLGASMAVSIGVTTVSTAFNLFAMRRQTFLAGAARRPLSEDLRQMPRLLAEFVLWPLRRARRRS